MSPWGTLATCPLFQVIVTAAQLVSVTTPPSAASVGCQNDPPSGRGAPGRERRSGRLHRLSAIIGTLSGLRRNPVRNASESASRARSTRGLPRVRRAFVPSNLRATSLRYHARMVSGRAHRCHLAEDLAAQSMTNLAERLARRPRTSPAPSIGLQEPVFGSSWSTVPVT
jgi:hypothetical protein